MEIEKKSRNLKSRFPDIRLGFFPIPTRKHNKTSQILIYFASFFWKINFFQCQKKKMYTEKWAETKDVIKIAKVKYNLV